MAAFGLLLLLGTAGVTVVALEQVAQDSLVLQHIEQQEVRQEELDPPLPTNPSPAGATLPPPLPATLPGFPPAWPVAAAVTRHCRDPPGTPSPAPPLPPSGFAHLRRQAAALDALRPRLDACCRHHAPLPCARRAWTDVLDAFCADEFGVKTRQFHCCRRDGAARRRCFAQRPDAVAAPPELFAPPQELSFPPGEPTAANLGNICALGGLQPGPLDPPGPRGRLLLRLERDYGRCCRNESLACAHDAWRKGLDRFCREEAAVKTKQHRCCQRGGGQRRGGARDRCFASAAPHPGYERNVSLARLEPPLLRALCGAARLVHPRPPVPELLEAVTGPCCPLPPPDQRPCARHQLSRAIAALCAAPPAARADPQGCCSLRGGHERRRCFDTSYLGHVTLGGPTPTHK